jgi:phage N-6-adenine-methyltransferase
VTGRRTIGASDNPAVLGGARAKNNGRYNGNGRHWETPPDLFRQLDAEFGFTLDPCATAATAKCPRFYTEEQNGLEQDWSGERVFMNPPYGREVYAWTRKARTSGARIVVGLLPASTDLAWWHDDIVGRAEVRYLRGRVRFLTGGPYRASGFFPSVIVIWREPPSPVPAILTLVDGWLATRERPCTFPLCGSPESSAGASGDEMRAPTEPRALCTHPAIDVDGLCRACLDKVALAVPVEFARRVAEIHRAAATLPAVTPEPTKGDQ